MTRAWDWGQISPVCLLQQTDDCACSGVNRSPPKNTHPVLSPQTCVGGLLEMRVSEDILKDLEMRSSGCSKQTLNPVTSVFKDTEKVKTQIRRRGHVRTGADTGVMQPQAEGRLGPPEAGRGRKGLPEAPRASTALPTPALRTSGLPPERVEASAVLSPAVCSSPKNKGGTPHSAGRQGTVQ